MMKTVTVAVVFDVCMMDVSFSDLMSWSWDDITTNILIEKKRNL